MNKSKRSFNECIYVDNLNSRYKIIASRKAKQKSKIQRRHKMGILAWIVLGGLAGWVASIIMGKNSSMGLIANIAVGIIGSFIGGYIMGTIDKHGVTGLDLRSFLVALLGSVILLAIANFFYKGRAR